MKILFLIFTFLILSGCVSEATSVSEVNKTAQPTPTVENANSNSNNQYSYTDYKVEQSLLDKLNEENEKFRQVPDEFKSVDFKNFKYDFGRLKDGELERNQTNDRLDGIFIYHFNDAFFVDLTNDEKKEAVVYLLRFGCGASCDGGAVHIYFFSSNDGEIRLIDTFESGSKSGGCSLKSITIRDKKIYLEQFGRCEKEQTYDKDNEYVCKFCAKDETHSTYSIVKSKLVRESIGTTETKSVNVLNSPTLISVND